MYQIALQNAQNQLALLTEKVSKGEEVIIVDNNGLSFQLIPFKAKPIKPTFGSASGLISMADDFDEPLDDFLDYSL